MTEWIKPVESNTNVWLKLPSDIQRMPDPLGKTMSWCKPTKPCRRVEIVFKAHDKLKTGEYAHQKINSVAMNRFQNAKRKEILNCKNILVGNPDKHKYYRSRDDAVSCE